MLLLGICSDPDVFSARAMDLMSSVRAQSSPIYPMLVLHAFDLVNTNSRLLKTEIIVFHHDLGKP
jgi:hypothetical protein